ncbi:phosphatidylserine decarboxylase, partial [Areca yellow leaf disease phytoplasma]
MLIFRLEPRDYHRWSSLDEGFFQMIPWQNQRKITYSKSHCLFEKFDGFKTNTREYSIYKPKILQIVQI